MICQRALRLLPFALLAPGAAHTQGASEAAVKAAYLTKFGAYVSWPAAGGPIVICVVGRDALGRNLDNAVSGQQIDGRPMISRQLEIVDRASGCDIAYVSGSSRQSVAAAIMALKGTSVLTVTDARSGNVRGMIHFQIASNRVRFHIDDQAAAQARLGISSKLLGLALSVRQRAGAR